MWRRKTLQLRGGFIYPPPSGPCRSVVSFSLAKDIDPRERPDDERQGYSFLELYLRALFEYSQGGDTHVLAERDFWRAAGRTCEMGNPVFSRHMGIDCPRFRKG